MNKILSSKWLHAALIRAIKTFAQSAVAAIGTTAMMSQVDFKIVLSTAALSALLSILTSLSGLPEVSEDKEDERTD